MKKIIFFLLAVILGIALLFWFFQGEYRYIGTFKSSSGVRVAVSARAEGEVSRLFTYEIIDPNGDTISSGNLSYIECSQGTFWTDFRLVEADNGKKLGLFLLWNAPDYEPENVLLLVHEVSTGDTFCRYKDGLDELDVGSLISACEEEVAKSWW